MGIELNSIHIYTIYVLLCLYVHRMLWKNTQETSNGCFKEEESNSGMGWGMTLFPISAFTIVFLYASSFITYAKLLNK